MTRIWIGPLAKLHSRIFNLKAAYTLIVTSE
jgi:hypothetical protein